MREILLNLDNVICLCLNQMSSITLCLFQVIPGDKKKCLEKLMEDMDEHYTQRVSENGCKRKTLGPVHSE